MDVLERDYVAKRTVYESMIASHSPNVDELKKMNTELSGILNNMLVELAKVKDEAGHIEEYRNELVKKLVAIQKDYTGLVNQEDQVETLKALRGHEEVKFNATFFWYALGLGIVSFLFFLVLVWKGGYKAPAIPTPISSATTTPAFM